MHIYRYGRIYSSVYIYIHTDMCIYYAASICGKKQIWYSPHFAIALFLEL